MHTVLTDWIMSFLCQPRCRLVYKQILNISGPTPLVQAVVPLPPAATHLPPLGEVLYLRLVTLATRHKMGRPVILFILSRRLWLKRTSVIIIINRNKTFISVSFLVLGIWCEWVFLFLYLVYDDYRLKLTDIQYFTLDTVACESIHPPWNFSYFVAL
jgi:hypothetical protein